MKKNTQKIAVQATEEEIMLLKHYQKVFMGSAYVAKQYGAEMLRLGQKKMHREDLQFVLNYRDIANRFIKKRESIMTKQIREINKENPNAEIVTQEQVSESLMAEFSFPLAVFSLTNTCSFDTGEDAEMLFEQIKVIVNEHNEKRLAQLSENQTNEVRQEDSAIEEQSTSN